MSSIAYYILGVSIVLILGPIPIIFDFKMRNAMIVFALGAFLGIGVIIRGGCEANHEQVQEAAQIVASPKKWLAQEMSDIQNVSLDGMVLLVDKEITRLKKFSETINDKQDIMVIGNAIGALERESECLRQMRSPAKCFKEESE